MSFIRFDESGASASGKTKVWDVVSVASGHSLGEVRWFAGWRGYVFDPFGAVFEQKCLRDIADFIERATKEHREQQRLTRSAPLFDAKAAA